MTTERKPMTPREVDMEDPSEDDLDAASAFWEQLRQRHLPYAPKDCS